MVPVGDVAPALDACRAAAGGAALDVVRTLGEPTWITPRRHGKVVRVFR